MSHSARSSPARGGSSARKEGQRRTVAVGAVTDDLPEETREPRRTLVPLGGKFMAQEQDDPPKRRRRGEAFTLSLFGWAIEQEREGRWPP